MAIRKQFFSIHFYFVIMLHGRPLTVGLSIMLKRFVFNMEKLNKYTLTKSQKSLVIEALKWDTMRQIDKLSFSVTFCKPRLKVLRELCMDDSLVFFWSKYQFGNIYRSCWRFLQTKPLYLPQQLLYTKFLSDFEDEFRRLFPYQTMYVKKYEYDSEKKCLSVRR